MKPLTPLVFLGRRTIPVWGLLALLATALCLAWQGWGAAEESRLLNRERDGMAALVRQASTPAKSMSAEERQRHAQIESVAQYLAAPWQVWLGVLEDNAKDKALVRRLEQDATNQTLKVTVRAVDSAEMMAYVIALQSDHRLRDVRLVSHEVLRNEPGTPLQFELVASLGTATAAVLPTSLSTTVRQP